MSKEKTAKNNSCHREWKRTTFLMALPATFLYSLFFIIPVAMGIYYSVTDWNGIARTNNFVGLKNYTRALTDKRFINALLFNLKYTVLYVIAIVVLSTIVAMLLNQKVKGITAFRAMYFLPALFSGVTISLIFNQIFFRVVPAVSKYFQWNSFQKSLLSDKSTAIYAILFVHLWCSLPLQSILVLAGLQTIPEELIEAAKIDGARKGQLFRHITLPHLAPTISIVTVLGVKSGLMIFDLIKVLTDGGPNNATRSVSMLIYNDAFKNCRYSQAMAEALIVGLIIAIISYIQININNRKSV